MKYVIEVTPETMVEIERLIREGSYASVLQFIELAIQNQLRIEEKEPGPLKAHEPLTITTTSKIAATELTEFLKNRVERPVLSGDSLSPEPGLTWALYNRILPVKIVLRVLVNMLGASSSSTVSLATLKEKSTISAAYVAKKLQRLDNLAKRQHGDKLATALPARNLDRTTKRFQEMFVGSVTAEGKPVGYPARLGFVVLSRDEKHRPIVSLTASGWEFAKMPNPVLDSEELGTDVHPFSEPEREYILNHLSFRLPDEYRLIAMITKKLSSSDLAPDDVDTLVRTGFPKLSSSEVPAARSGIISRLVELGLVRRTRDGLNVRYSLSQRDSPLLQTH